MMAEDKARTGRQDGDVVGQVAALGWSGAAQRWTAGAGAGHRSPQAARGAPWPGHGVDHGGVRRCRRGALVP